MAASVFNVNRKDSNDPWITPDMLLGRVSAEEAEAEKMAEAEAMFRLNMQAQREALRKKEQQKTR